MLVADVALIFPAPQATLQRMDWKGRITIDPETRGALIDIHTLAVFSGMLPPRATGLVIKRAPPHQRELLADWDRACAREELQKIAPLE